MRSIAQSPWRVNQTKWPILAGYELWILCAAAPFLLFPGRWTPAALAAIALTWVLRRLAFGAFTVRTPADAPLLFLLLAAAAGLYLSPDRSAASDAFWRLLLGIAIFYGLANGIRDRRGLLWLSFAVAAGGVGLVLLTLLGTRWDAVRLLSLPDLYGRLPELLRDPQDGQPFHPRVMAMGLATLFPAVLAITLSGADRRLRLAAGAATLAIALMLLLTQPVQALLGAGCAVLFLALAWSRWFLLLPVVVAAAAIAIPSALNYDLRALAARLLSVGDVAGIGVALRLDMWGRALAMIHDMPFTGIGLNAFPAIQINFYPGYLLGPEPHAHNLYLQLALDLGFPGLLAFLWLLVAAWRHGAGRLPATVPRGMKGRWYWARRPVSSATWAPD